MFIARPGWYLNVKKEGGFRGKYCPGAMRHGAWKSSNSNKHYNLFLIPCAIFVANNSLTSLPKPVPNAMNNSRAGVLFAKQRVIFRKINYYFVQRVLFSVSARINLFRLIGENYPIRDSVFSNVAYLNLVQVDDIN